MRLYLVEEGTFGMEEENKIFMLTEWVFGRRKGKGKAEVFYK